MKSIDQSSFPHQERERERKSKKERENEKKSALLTFGNICLSFLLVWEFFLPSIITLLIINTSNYCIDKNIDNEFPRTGLLLTRRKYELE